MHYHTLLCGAKGAPCSPYLLWTAVNVAQLTADVELIERGKLISWSVCIKLTFRRKIWNRYHTFRILCGAIVLLHSIVRCKMGQRMCCECVANSSWAARSNRQSWFMFFNTVRILLPSLSSAAPRSRLTREVHGAGTHAATMQRVAKICCIPALGLRVSLWV